MQDRVAKSREAKMIIYKQEEQYDDCGSNMTLLEEAPYLSIVSMHLDSGIPWLSLDVNEWEDHPRQKRAHMI